MPTDGIEQTYFSILFFQTSSGLYIPHIYKKKSNFTCSGSRFIIYRYIRLKRQIDNEVYLQCMIPVLLPLTQNNKFVSTLYSGISQYTV